jgi:hypothetical protein
MSVGAFFSIGSVVMLDPYIYETCVVCSLQLVFPRFHAFLKYLLFCLYYFLCENGNIHMHH